MYEGSFFIFFIINFLIFSGAAVQAKTPKEIYKSYKESVLLVLSKEDDGSSSSGTAFAIDNEGTFVTAAHVIFTAKEFKLVTYDYQEIKVKKVLWIDRDNDLAIFQAEQKGISAIPLASYQSAEVGEKLTIVSYPKGDELGGYDSTLSEGLLSSIRRKFTSERVEKDSPTYDKEKPIIYKADIFYKNLKADCKLIEEKEHKTVQVLKCSNGRIALLDMKNNNNVLYDNYDIAIKQGHSVYYFPNQNQSLANPVKTVGVMLQYTTPISPGSSGGPIFNENGEVIGVVNSYLEDAQSVNFGRPIDYLPSEYLEKNHLATLNSQKQIAQSR